MTQPLPVVRLIGGPMDGLEIDLDSLVWASHEVKVPPTVILTVGHRYTVSRRDTTAYEHAGVALPKSELGL